ncbi:hypothetical protein BJX63DRAFT_426090 [Aspergillus granulosus]|uniref:Nucleoside phosphorylase domain-containing protein n=1 Tax=Aspergillus granulosus TaxID=176169 RepID=A0ABR4GTK7_9EURO
MPPSKRHRISSSVGREDETVSLTPEDYTVGIVCALSIEMAAVSAMLDSVHNPVPLGSGDHNSYTLGRIGVHNIVIACLPAGVYGTTSAAVVASNLTISFPYIRVSLMVGIAGGVPSNTDIRLGDVVVSKPTAGSGGVVQYDYGKAVSSGHLLRTGMLNKPPQTLLTAISKLEADHMLRGSDLPEELSKLAANSRILFHANYEHVDGQKTCDECDSSFLVARARRANDLPAIHYGLIASGNQVMKHAGTRDRLAKELNILCFEMEAAGMMDHFPCLVIRGICDYSDSHKSKEWQGYAAATAAAYARELLRVVPGRQVEVTRAISATSSNAGLVHRVSHWLASMDFSAIQHDWLLKSAEYEAWSSGTQPTLFCHGIPGADIQMRFGHDEQTEQSPTDMLSSLIKQLVEEQPALPEALEALYEYHIRRGTRPMLHELAQILVQIIGQFRRVFWIIDALDECADTDGARANLLRVIGRLQKQTTLSLFVTSRPNPEIQSQFQSALSMEIRASVEDIQRYLADQMPRLPLCVSQDPVLQDIIKAEIVRAADGMFLLAQLHIDSLYDKTTRKSIRKALKELPEGIDELDNAYESAMRRITSQKYGFKKLAIRVLLWITCTKRPLTTQELRHALAVEVSEPEIDEENLPEVADMVSVCAGLVTIDQESNIIRLVHYTTQDYFQRTQQNWFPNAEAEVAATCIAYLSFSAFATGHCYTDESFESRVEANALFSYAACNWGHHARETSSVLDKTVLDFLENEARLSSSTQAMTVSFKQPGYSQDIPQHVTGVHLAAYFGLTNALGTLLNNGHYPDREDTLKSLLKTNMGIDPNSRDGQGRSPLSWAAERGHEATVTLLLQDYRVNPDIADRYGQTPLSLAAANGRATVTGLLLSNSKVSPISVSKEGRTPLCFAAMHGHVSTVKVLLKKCDSDSIVPDVQDDCGRTPLLWAAKNGHERVVEALLATGKVNTYLKDKSGRTSLVWAQKNGHHTIARLLASEKMSLVWEEYKRNPI